jgi:RNA polymerase-binding transcription factor DksA
MAKKESKKIKIGKDMLNEIKLTLETEKIAIEQELQKIATKNEKIPGDWKSKFPFGNSESGSASLERQADEVEEYTTRLPIEHNLELKLQDIDLALNKIKKETYGFCDNCDKTIPIERLKIYPAAKYCLDCQKK